MVGKKPEMKGITDVFLAGPVDWSRAQFGGRGG